jgi:YD repeat-containing protein
MNAATPIPAADHSWLRTTVFAPRGPAVRIDTMPHLYRRAPAQVLVRMHRCRRRARRWQLGHATLLHDRLGRDVAVRDANGNVNGQAYGGSGNLTEERHADGGIVRYLYNAFGNRTRMVDAMGNTVRYELDQLGRVVAMNRGSAYVNGVDGNNNLIPGVLRDIVVTTAYDQAGRQLWIANGAGETTRFTYDLRGNVTEARQPLGQATRSVFDAFNRKIAEVDANELAATWNTDYFGQLQGHTDLGGHRQVYAYSRAGQLTDETGSRGQHKGYAYDGAGQLTRIDDDALHQQSLYTYDAAANRTGEKTLQGGITYQDNLLAYGGQNRLRRLNALGGVQLAGYLRHVLTYIADYPIIRIEDLLPWNGASRLNRIERRQVMQKVV